MQRSSDAQRLGGVGAWPPAAGSRYAESTGRQCTASSSSSSSCSSADLSRDAAAYALASLDDPNGLSSPFSIYLAGGSESSVAAPAGQAASPQMSPSSLPPTVQLLPDCHQVAAPYYWRSPGGLLQTTDGPRPPTPRALFSTPTTSSEQAPKTPERRSGFGPLGSPLSLVAGRYARRGQAPSPKGPRREFWALQDGASPGASGGSPWHSEPVSFAPTPTGFEAETPALSPTQSMMGGFRGSSSHAASTATSGSGDSGAAPFASTRYAIDAQEVAGALAQLPQVRHKPPPLRLDGIRTEFGRPGAAVSALPSAHPSHVENSPDALHSAPYSAWGETRSHGRSALSSPDAQRGSWPIHRSISHVSLASDDLAPRPMDQSVSSLVSHASHASGSTEGLWDSPQSARAPQSCVTFGENSMYSEWFGSSESGSPTGVRFGRTPLHHPQDGSDAPSDASSVHNSDQDSESDYFGAESFAPSEAGDAGPPLPQDPLGDTLYRDEGEGRYATVELKACANSAVAVQRSLLLPTPLTHVSHCLSRGKGYLAVLRPDGQGLPELQVLWLTAPESMLPAVPTPQTKPRLPLAWGLSLEPPLGRRGAVPPPVVGRHTAADAAPGSTLLAALFSQDEPSAAVETAELGQQQQHVFGFVTARPEAQAQAPTQVTWHSGPGLIWQWTQPLMAVRSPRVQFSPDGSALVLQSATHAPDPFAAARVLDGVWLYVMAQVMEPGGVAQEAGQPLVEGRRWVLREPQSLVPPGATVPTFGWTHNDQSTVMVSQAGVRVFDTRSTDEVVHLRQELMSPLPKQLLAPGALVAAGALSFDPSQRHVAVNWATHGASGEVQRRMGQVVRLDVARGPEQAGPLQAPTWAIRPQANPYEMIHFLNTEGDALWARPSDAQMLYCSTDQEGLDKPSVRSAAGASETFTRRHKHLLLPLGLKHRFLAMVSRSSMRLYMSFDTLYRPAQRRYQFAEKRPAYLEALRHRGIEPSPNRLTLAPFFDSQERNLFVGFDNDVLQRYDLQPNRGRDLPTLLEADLLWLGTFDPKVTPWALSDGPNLPSWSAYQ